MQVPCYPQLLEGLLNPGAPATSYPTLNVEGSSGGIGSSQGTYPALMAKRLNLSWSDVQQTIQEARAAGPIPIFTL